MISVSNLSAQSRAGLLFLKNWPLYGVGALTEERHVHKLLTSTASNLLEPRFLSLNFPVF